MLTFLICSCPFICFCVPGQSFSSRHFSSFNYWTSSALFLMSPLLVPMPRQGLPTCVISLKGIFPPFPFYFTTGEKRIPLYIMLLKQNVMSDWNWHLFCPQPVMKLAKLRILGSRAPGPSSFEIPRLHGFLGYQILRAGDSPTTASQGMSWPRTLEAQGSPVIRQSIW